MSINNSERRALTAPRLLGRAVALCGTAAIALLGSSAIAAADDVCPNAAIREAQGSSHLPNCMAYERISWQNPGGQIIGTDVSFRPTQSFMSPDGDRVLYYGTSQLGPRDERGIVLLNHFADRTGDGWQTTPLITLKDATVITDALSSAQTGLLPSRDLSTVGFSVSRSLGPPAPGNSTYISSGAGTERWISAAEAGAVQGAGGTVVGGTPDFSTVYFTTNSRLTTQAGDATRTGQGLYEYRDGVLRAAGLLPNGTVAPAGVSVGDLTRSTSSIAPLQYRNAVSRDGRRVFFSAVVDRVRQLYVREDGARTRLLSHAKDAPLTPSTGGIAPNTVQFHWSSVGGNSGFIATPDGSRALFASTDALTEAAEAEDPRLLKFYRVDVATANLTYLPGITGTPVEVNADASRILWQKREATTRSVMLWDDATGRNYELSGPVPFSTGTPDMSWVGTNTEGSVWTLQHTQALDPRFPVTNTRSQVYRWEFGDRSFTCLSCLPGVTYDSNTNLNTFSASPTEYLGRQTGTPQFNSQIANRAMSKDGNRVFFDTRTALVPEDMNGVRDVYMWERSRGLTLLSGGDGIFPSWFHDASESGEDVLMITASGLVPSDENGSSDLYTVRVNGGFVERDPDASCGGDACQPPGDAPTTSARAGSDQVGDSDRAPDDLAPAPARITVRKVRGRKANGRAIQIATSSAGTLRASGARIATTNRRLSRKGKVRLSLRLTPAARRILIRRGRVVVPVRVVFTPSTGRAVAATLKTTIKRNR